MADEDVMMDIYEVHRPEHIVDSELASEPEQDLEEELEEMPKEAQLVPDNAAKDTVLAEEDDLEIDVLTKIHVMIRDLVDRN